MKLLVQISLFSLLCFLVVDAVGFGSVGGLGESHKPDRSFKKMVRKLKAEAQLKSSETYPMFKAKSYKQQVVGGMMYYVKVKTGKWEFIHLKIYKPLDANLKPELESIKSGVKKHDEIQYFI